MKEVLFRRFSKAVKDIKNALSLPDLLLIDGGKGQYSVARKTITKIKFLSASNDSIAYWKIEARGIRENGTTDLTYTRFLGSGTGNMSMLTETTAYVNDVADYFEIYLYNSVACEVRSASGAYSYFGGYKLIGV